METMTLTTVAAQSGQAGEERPVVERAAAPQASACCGATEQATCCAPEAKASCCGTTVADGTTPRGGCGCR